MDEDIEPRHAWICICSEDFLTFLRRAHAGEDPEMVYMEMYANCQVESYEEED